MLTNTTAKISNGHLQVIKGTRSQGNFCNWVCKKVTGVVTAFATGSSLGQNSGTKTHLRLAVG
jgi:hypothetical protein